MTDKRCSKHPEVEPMLVINAPDNRHYGKWVCSKCDRYLSHAKLPKTTENMEIRQETIRKMIKTEEDESQLHFLCSIYMVPHLNLVQEKKFMAVKK